VQNADITLCAKPALNDKVAGPKGKTTSVKQASSSKNGRSIILSLQIICWTSMLAYVESS
jgi:uncharacterized protein YdeI (BOF family)